MANRARRSVEPAPEPFWDPTLSWVQRLMPAELGVQMLLTTMVIDKQLALAAAFRASEDGEDLAS